MMAIPGSLAIIVSFGLSLISGAAFLVTAIGRKNLYEIGRKAFHLQLYLVSFSLLYLWYLFFSNNYAFKYVYEYSSSGLSFFYKLSALWAGQDGTYLLWLFLSLLFGLILLRKVKLYSTVSMVVLTLVNMFLYIMLLTISPFRLLGTPAPEGAGLNPLLQDPWMVIHPPIVFIGFAMSGIVFATVAAAIIKNNYKNWVQIVFPYVGFTALALAIANVLGGYWAYKTLGWGGYWAWDPVENTSFIPWVIGLAVIHGMLIEKKSGAFRRINLFQAMSIFLLSIYGTFLTRSGVLADFSVHSFVDLGANAVLITFILFYFISTAFLTIRAIMATSGRPMEYDIHSRPFILFIGMTLLGVLGLIVLFWSSLPFLTTYLTSEPRAAEIPTYNSFAFPLAILISLLLTLSPYVKKSNKRSDSSKFILPAAILIGLFVSGGLFLADLIDFAMAATLLIYLFVMFYYLGSGNRPGRMVVNYLIGMAIIMIAVMLGVRDVKYLFFIGAAGAAIATHVIMMIKLMPDGFKRRGGSLSHLGYGLMLLGILASSAFSRSEIAVLPRNEITRVGEYGYEYRGLSGAIMQDNNEILLTLSRDGRQFEARPQYFYTARMDGIIKRPHIEKNLFYDIYMAPQEIQELPHADQGLVMTKGDTEQIADYKINFTGFEIGSHESGQAGMMSVGVVLEVEKDGVIETVTPRFFGGRGNAGDGDVYLFSDSLYEVRVEKINADHKIASLSIPGLIEAGPPDRLVLDISYKPGINLLWLGTIIVFIGMGLSIFRRYKY